jgi:hypothetical protein
LSDDVVFAGLSVEFSAITLGDDDRSEADPKFGESAIRDGLGGA